MNRVLVIGCAGAGKSTFSKKLAQNTGLPLVFLDQLFWQEGWIEKGKRLFVSEISDLISKENWIMDGNYKGTLRLRLTRADTVIFLDLGRTRCLWHVFTRTIKTLGKVRDDMPDGCPERFDWKFTKHIWHFPRDHRPILIEMLQEFDGSVVCLKNLSEYRDYLANINTQGVTFALI